MPKSLFGKAVIPIVGLILFILIADYMVSSEEFPSLGEFIAESTDTTATSTDEGGRSGKNAVAIFDGSYSTTTVGAPKGTVEAYVANNPAKREIGLGGLASLPGGTGLIFIFPEPGKYGFWMKDMNFPIDIVWMRSDMAVIAVSKNILPSTFPETLYPPVDVQFVLELNAGESDKFGIATGTRLAF